jgi:hypothetical protein
MGGTARRTAVALATLGAAGALALCAPLAAIAADPATVTSGCIAHPFNDGEYSYTAGCTGHDEPELDPVSSHPGSGQEMTWKAVLPSDGVNEVADVGPTFWWGGTVNDPTSEFGQAFYEIQFYPDARLRQCLPSGSFVLVHQHNSYGVCTPVWKIDSHGREPAAMNAELDSSHGTGPMQMWGGDTVTVHTFVTAGHNGLHIEIKDLTPGHRDSGIMVLHSATDGPLLPSYDTQEIGNALGWGIVDDTPNSFVWEIGHTSDFTTPPAQFCLPGDTTCNSYDFHSWASFHPLLIKSVKFGDGSTPEHWAVVSDYGGINEVLNLGSCTSYGDPFCIYPWYAWNKAGHGFTYGVDYPGTQDDFGRVSQFQGQLHCPSSEGDNTTYCDTIVR